MESYVKEVDFAYKYFKEDFYSVLNNEDLLPDDMYFVPYKVTAAIYDKILYGIGDIEQYESIKKTLQYFKQEFLIGDE